MWISDYAIRKPIVTTVVMIALVVFGLVALKQLDTDEFPDVEVPLVNVRLVHFGISPEDAERLLVRPVEQELRSLEGVKQLSSLAYQDGANLVVEFDAGRNTDQSLADVRAKVDMARSKLPADSEEPVVVAATMAEQQPILVLNNHDDLETFTPRAMPYIRDGRLVGKPDWGHGFLDLRTAEFARLVRDFVDA